MMFEPAFAKLNLALHVTGRRADGYHLLSSLVAFAEVQDVLQVEAADEFSLTVDGPFAPTLALDAPNLVTCAAQLLAEVAGVEAKMRLRLTKNLPVGAGVGGGSADAAAALRLLARLWDVTLPPSEWQRIALSLGADVPVCLASRTSYMSGIGEIIEPGPSLPAWGVILVNPGFPLATAEVFRQFKGAYDAPLPLLVAGEDPRAWLSCAGNSLQAPAIALMPEITQLLEAINALPGCLLARMSGSGATCFGLFASVKEAKEAADRLGKTHPHWWIAPSGLR